MNIFYHSRLRVSFQSSLAQGLQQPFKAGEDQAGFESALGGNQQCRAKRVVLKCSYWPFYLINRCIFCTSCSTSTESFMLRFGFVSRDKTPVRRKVEMERRKQFLSTERTMQGGRNDIKW